MRIDIDNAVKTFPGGERPALNGISMTVADGELVALLGPSGSGKTTLLRAIAGLETLEGGEIRFDGENVAGRDARDRNVGFVFQHYALFRTMTVEANVGFGLSVRPRATRPPKAEIRRRARELLRLVHLEGFEARYPAQLSGGQRQRVALARALAIDPGVLLLDEPFGALDARVRKELRRWLRELHDRTGHTTLFVTHDQEEALELADRVAVIDGGRLEQIAPPAELYAHPATPFVCEFLGSVNRVDTPEGVAYVRAHEIGIAPPGAPHGLAATVVAVRAAGPRAHVELEIAGGRRIEAELPAEEAARLAPGHAAAAVIRRSHTF
ncbi:Sulfate/thiosulfate import ATP-binding protein CysA [uncultured Alphaproteobacteria bacterium]|uniref:Sulfate/thiosulfate import ATP-binding protein CysA n=1 Tax=uncultured Alphaproteobacteria bacterium TaxID=91750 RepID=A0A212IW80_9PROT|nr:Sulfate/thiosulfate import ATP-binding protein CysA [uncultured Alphaproteobacteria bacterium]